MLGPNKWRLLTIVAGVLLAHAIDSPVRQSVSYLPRYHTTSAIEHAAAIEHFTPQTAKTARNLYRPYEAFSNVDNVRYVDKRIWTDRKGRSTSAAAFGAFRYPYYDVSRRSDEPLLNSTITSGEITPSQSPSLSAITVTPTSRVKRPTYSYIPLKAFDEQIQPKINITNPTPTSTLPEEIQSRTDTDPFIEPVTDSSQQFATTQNIKGRRSGIQFSAQSQKLDIPFTPQSYREDSPNNPEFQLPYNEELSQPESSDVRYSRQVSYDQLSARPIRFPDRQVASVEPFRDDVTKFGDVNGPVTVQQRQYSDYSDYIRPSYENYYISDDYSSRPTRQYFPPKSYVEYSDYPGPPRSRLTSPYKSSRTPRVVFPSQSDLTFPGTASATSAVGSSTGSGYANDNVVFR